mgnify:CR=1 FL=1
MVYPVSSPAPAAYITILVIALLLGVLMLSFGWSMSRVALVVGTEAVELRAPFYGRSIAMSAIDTEAVRVVDLAEESPLRPGLRTGGVGLPGFQLGWFRLQSGDRALLAVTDRSRVVYLPHADGIVLVSVDDPAGLVTQLGGARP